jgi:hypothetical protein
MFLRFAFCLLAIIFAVGISPLLLQINAWGGFYLVRGVMECRKEAARMMVRHGAVLMRGGGRKEGGKRTEGGGELIVG